VDAVQRPRAMLVVACGRRGKGARRVHGGWPLPRRELPARFPPASARRC
jgi:hypothetical protein